MGIENCRVLGTASGRVDLLSRGGSVATGAGCPPGSAGVSPAYDVARWNQLCKGKLGAPCMGLAVDDRLLAAIRSQAGCPPGSAGVSPAYDVARWNQLCKGKLGSPCMGLAVDDRLLAVIVSRTGCPPGSTGNHATALLRPRTRRARRRGGWLPHRRRAERNATAVHAGGTPALPGGVPLPQCSRHSLGPFPSPDSTGCQWASKIAGFWALKIAGFWAPKVAGSTCCPAEGA